MMHLGNLLQFKVAGFKNNKTNLFVAALVLKCRYNTKRVVLVLFLISFPLTADRWLYATLMIVLLML